jgi:hypothetical protein
MFKSNLIKNSLFFYGTGGSICSLFSRSLPLLFLLSDLSLGPLSWASMDEWPTCLVSLVERRCGQGPAGPAAGPRALGNQQQHRCRPDLVDGSALHNRPQPDRHKCTVRSSPGGMSPRSGRRGSSSRPARAARPPPRSHHGCQ